MLLAACVVLSLSQATVLPRAHSHNDYLRQRPLEEALEQGFGSVEVDVFLVDGELRVGHDLSELRPRRTLQALYLDPLHERFKKHQGIYPGFKNFILLVDIKRDGPKVAVELQKVLSRYKPMLTHFEANGSAAWKTKQTGAVQVILSGDRPIKFVVEEQQGFWAPRLLFLDGRLNDSFPEHDNLDYVPLVSGSFAERFRWRGEGDLPPQDLVRLRLDLMQTHEYGQKLRYWAVPDQREAWKLLYEAGVDLINTDKPAELSEFLRKTG